MPTEIKDSFEATVHAMRAGFAYKGYRVGVSFYQHKDGRRIEIARTWAAEYRAPVPQSELKVLRQTRLWKFDNAAAH